MCWVFCLFGVPGIYTLLAYRITRHTVQFRSDMMREGDCDILIHGYTAGIRDIHRHYLVSQTFYLFDRMREDDNNYYRPFICRLPPRMSAYPVGTSTTFIRFVNLPHSLLIWCLFIQDVAALVVRMPYIWCLRTAPLISAILPAFKRHILFG